LQLPAFITGVQRGWSHVRSGFNRVKNRRADHSIGALIMQIQIELPEGRKATTLRDAALYITKLPKAERQAPE
jgi:hypothetical protein